AILVKSINGPETEGSAASYVPASSTPSYAWNAGTGIPPLGTPLVCHAVGGRWVFRYDGASTPGGLPGGGEVGGGGALQGGGMMARQGGACRRHSGRAVVPQVP